MADRHYRYSAVKKFKRCRRSWALGYERGLELAPMVDGPVSDSGRSLGTLVHAGVEAYRLGGNLAEVLAPVEAAVASAAEAALGPDIHPERLKMFEMARLMLEGYVEWQETDGARPAEETVLVEHQMSLDMGVIRGDRVFLTGKADEVLRNTVSGQIIVNDVKTVAQFDKDQQFWIDDQLLAYAYMLDKTEGLRPSVGRHTMLRKVGRSARAKPPFYDIADIYISPQMLDSVEHTLYAVLDDMVSVSQDLEHDPFTHTAYPNPTRDCSWDCDFLGVCSMFGDESPGAITVALDSVYVRREA